MVRSRRLEDNSLDEERSERDALEKDGFQKTVEKLAVIHFIFKAQKLSGIINYLINSVIFKAKISLTLAKLKVKYSMHVQNGGSADSGRACYPMLWAREAAKIKNFRRVRIHNFDKICCIRLRVRCVGFTTTSVHWPARQERTVPARAGADPKLSERSLLDPQQWRHMCVHRAMCCAQLRDYSV